MGPCAGPCLVCEAPRLWVHTHWAGSWLTWPVPGGMWVISCKGGRRGQATLQVGALIISMVCDRHGNGQSRLASAACYCCCSCTGPLTAPPGQTPAWPGSPAASAGNAHGAVLGAKGSAKSRPGELSVAHALSRGTTTRVQGVRAPGPVTSGAGVGPFKATRLA